MTAQEWQPGMRVYVLAEVGDVMGNVVDVKIAHPCTDGTHVTTCAADLLPVAQSDADAIERAAEALYEEERNESMGFDAWPDWDSLDGEVRSIYLGHARAALTAANLLASPVREPGRSEGGEVEAATLQERMAATVRAGLARAGVSQADAAAYLSVSQKHLSQMLTGKVDGSLSMWQRLLDFVNVHAGLLAGGVPGRSEAEIKAEGAREALDELESQWYAALDSSGCPSCGPVGYTGCDHIEGYHHALSDIRERAIGRAAIRDQFAAAYQDLGLEVPAHLTARTARDYR